MTPLYGILNINKPPGPSSARIVSMVKRLLPKGTKIGHAGTLDPFAAGVLLLLVGKATKRCEELMSEPKQYEATVRFGFTTETDDPESPQIPFPSARPVSREQIEQVLPQFQGLIQQRPPIYSAMKVGGRRAYALARSGAEVKLEPRQVRIDRIEILDFTWPLLKLRIDCGRGTYIRAIARDLGEALGVGGYLTELKRTKVGRFLLSDAIELAQVQQTGVEPHLMS